MIKTALSVESDPRYEGRLVPINNLEAIPESWRGTPIESIILAENFGQPVSPSPNPQLLIATCIEFRYALPIPSMYAYVVRRASGRLNGSEFSIAYVLSKGVKHVALIGHNDCGMTKVGPSATAMTEALVDQGWYKDRAEEFISYHQARYSIEDELTALEREFHRLKRLFKNLEIAPLFVNLADTKLHIPKWYLDYLANNESPEPVHDEDLLTLY